MLKTVDGETVDPKDINFPIRDGVEGQKGITAVVMKDGTEKLLRHGHKAIVDAIVRSREVIPTSMTRIERSRSRGDRVRVETFRSPFASEGRLITHTAGSISVLE